MAGLERKLPLLQPINGRSKAILSTSEHYIRYKCAECNRTHSVLAKVRAHKGQYYTIVNSLGNVQVSVSMDDPQPATLRFASMKLLDALDIDYFPETVRMVKA